jgi:putative transposase
MPLLTKLGALNLEHVAGRNDDRVSLSTLRVRAKGPPHTSLGQRPRGVRPNASKKGLKARFIKPRHRSTSPERPPAMPQSLSLVLLHVVFSTKDRRSLLEPAVRPGLNMYLATVARNAGCECYRVGGVADHVHLAIRLSRTIKIADLLEELKTSSSKSLKTDLAQIRDFAWQRGYGAFSVGPGDLPALIAYIDNQEEHHRTRTFQDEYRAFLNKYGIEFDERYVWD